MVVNAFFGWDFNSCESLRSDGVWHPIDFANACPDSQVTSLHFHFPWLVKANLRWSLFCAATRRRVKTNLDWDRYYEIADTDASFEEKLAGYTRLAKEHFDTENFESFCDTHLSHLDEVAQDFFQSDTARSAIQQKVEALYPAHEIDEYTELFWGRVQDSLREEAGTAT
jgi:hypothetical protein